MRNRVIQINYPSEIRRRALGYKNDSPLCDDLRVKLSSPNLSDLCPILTDITTITPRTGRKADCPKRGDKANSVHKAKGDVRGNSLLAAKITILGEDACEDLNYSWRGSVNA
jgi:hypothetical protein